MKIKIKNVFEPEKEITLEDLLDNKEVSLEKDLHGPNITISLKNKAGYPCFINMSKTACLAISFLED